MDLRDLNVSVAYFEDGFFSCSNFDRTKLIGTKLRNARLKWASLRHADLTKADLTGTCLFRADVAGAKFSDDVDRNMLKEVRWARYSPLLGPCRACAASALSSAALRCISLIAGTSRACA